MNHLKNLSNTNNLFICGPYKTSDSAIQILIAESIGEARKLVESDPFIKSGYYKDYDLDELIEANDSNNFLLSPTKEKIKTRTKNI